MSDTITVPRVVLEQALEALTNCYSTHGHRCNRCDSEVDEGGNVAAALSAALEQQQVKQEPQQMVSAFRTSHAYSIGFKDGQKSMPQVKQEPVAWQYRMRPDWGSKKDCWGPWQDCTMEQAAMYQRVPLLHDWAYESRQLYTHPQPPCQPLTCEEISFIAAACGGLASDFVVSVARAIEAAHGVNGRK